MTEHMEGENYPYFFVQPSSTFQLPNSSMNGDISSYDNNGNGNSPSVVLNQSMQIPEVLQQVQYPACSDQIDLSGLLYSGSTFMEQNPVSVSALSDVRGSDDHNNINLCKRNKSRSGKRKKPCVPPRVAFHTRSDEDILDDGYKWRKYGQKSVKNSDHPRSYYRCTHHTCNVKKQIQRFSKDTSIVVTTYEGIHNHPCEKLMETLSPLLKQLQLLSRSF